MGYIDIKDFLHKENVELVAVSKTKSKEQILEIYNQGQKIFGENKVLEMCEKHNTLPKDIDWHMIGHLQTNKVKLIVPFVKLIHSVDSLKLLKEINSQSEKINKKSDILLQVYIASEDTKYGLDEKELDEIIKLISQNTFPFISLKGLMGMASNTLDKGIVKKEFALLYKLFLKLKKEYPTLEPEINTLSMGMSNDFEIAIEEGSNMVRIGTLLFV